MRDVRTPPNLLKQQLLRILAVILITISNIIVVQNALAQSDQIMETRTNNVATLLAGGALNRAIFTENFLNAVPEKQVITLRDQLLSTHGALLSVEKNTKLSINHSSLVAHYERADAHIDLTLEPIEPHRIAGLVISSVEDNSETLIDVMAAMQKLPGRNAFGVFRLGQGQPELFVGHANNARFAIASAFKLYILAEIDRAIRAGERRWSDVVYLGPKSHPSGILQDWPDDSPLTLQSLANLMISRSDNSATDTLIRVIGQEKLANIVRETGHANPQYLIPMLMTQHVSALKMPHNDTLREQFVSGDDARQTILLSQNPDKLGIETIDLVTLTSGPLHLDDIEWFANTQDMARILDYLRLNASAETKAILAINPGIGNAIAGRFRYLGYKGGSNQGVLTLNFLLQKQDGEWLAVSALWNNADAPLDDSKFFPLVTRAIAIIADQSVFPIARQQAE